MIKATLLAVAFLCGCGADQSLLSGNSNNSNTSNSPGGTSPNPAFTPNAVNGQPTALPPVVPEGTYRLASVSLITPYDSGFYTLGRGGITLTVKWDSSRKVHIFETRGTQELSYDGVLAGIRGCSTGPQVVEVCIDRFTYKGDPACSRMVSDPCGQAAAIGQASSRGEFEFLEEAFTPGFDSFEDQVSGYYRGGLLITKSRYIRN
ncbi:MAG: hypothetical protein RL011_2046 [Pseudomonadota bacterium]